MTLNKKAKDQVVKNPRHVVKKQFGSMALKNLTTSVNDLIVTLDNKVLDQDTRKKLVTATTEVSSSIQELTVLMKELVVSTTLTLSCKEEQVLVSQAAMEVVGQVREEGEVTVMVEVRIEGPKGEVEGARRNIRSFLKKSVVNSNVEHTKVDQVNSKSNCDLVFRGAELQEEQIVRSKERISLRLTWEEADIIRDRKPAAAILTIIKKTGAKMIVNGEKNDDFREVILSGSEESIKKVEEEIKVQIKEGMVVASVTRDKAGTVLGIGGRTIRGIKKKCRGAKIHVRGSHEDMNRKVYIRGSRDAIDQAKNEVARVLQERAMTKFSGEERNIYKVSKNAEETEKYVNKQKCKNKQKVLEASKDEENNRVGLVFSGVQLGKHQATRQKGKVSVTLSRIEVGLLLSNKGKVINKIQRSSGAELDLAGKFGDEKNVITISGSDMKVKKAEEEMASAIREGIVEATVTTKEVKILDGHTLSLIMKKTETVMRTREEGGIGKLFIRGSKEAILKAKIEVTKLLK